MALASSCSWDHDICSLLKEACVHGAYLRGSAKTPAITSACVAGALVSRGHSGTCGTCCGKYPMPSSSGIGGRSIQLIGPYCRPLSTARPAQEQNTSAYSHARTHYVIGGRLQGLGPVREACTCSSYAKHFHMTQNHLAAVRDASYLLFHPGVAHNLPLGN